MWKLLFRGFKSSVFILTFILLLIVMKGSTFNKTVVENYPIEGYGLTLVGKEMETIKNFYISSNDSDYNIVFVNNTDRKNTFMLLAYLDYNQTTFQVGTLGENNHYVFTAEPREEIVIPISFIQETMKTSKTLLLSVIAGIDKLTSDLGDSSPYYSVNSRYHLNNNKLNGVQTDTSKSLEPFIDSFFAGILLTPDPVHPDEIVLPPLEMTVKKDDFLELSLRAGGHESTEDYIAWLIIDGKQVHLKTDDQNAPYLEFSVREGHHTLQNLHIEPPEKVGKYDVMAFLVSNPWKNFDPLSRVNLRIDTSHRFTIHVE